MFGDMGARLLFTVQPQNLNLNLNLNLNPQHHPKARAAWEVAGSADADADGPGCTNGFAFEGADAGSLDYALNRAIDAYYNDKVGGLGGWGGGLCWWVSVAVCLLAWVGCWLGWGARCSIAGAAPIAPTSHRPPPTLNSPTPSPQAWFRALQSRVMTMDWSWNKPALQFVDLYYAATKQ